MTRPANLPNYGHALCPHCKVDFDLAQAAPSFGVPFRKEVILFVMCPSCASHFSRRGPSSQKKMMKKCSANVKFGELTQDGSRTAWALTSLFTLEINQGNLVAAIENGIGLTRELYQGLVDGTHTLTVLPGGLKLITEVENCHD
jgi:hypothetical protein